MEAGSPLSALFMFVISVQIRLENFVSLVVGLYGTDLIILGELPKCFFMFCMSMFLAGDSI